MNLTKKFRNMVDEIEELSIEVAQAKETISKEEAAELQELSGHLFTAQSFFRYNYLPVLRDFFGEEDV